MYILIPIPVIDECPGHLGHLLNLLLVTCISYVQLYLLMDVTVIFNCILQQTGKENPVCLMEFVHPVITHMTRELLSAGNSVFAIIFMCWFFQC